MATNLNRFLWRGRVTGARKAQFTLSVTLGFTLTIEQGQRGERVCVRKNDHFGHGQNTVLGWSDPKHHFGHGTVCKSGVAPAQHNFLRCLARVRRRILDEIGEGRRLIR